jgi:hypothetical protein
LTNFAWPAVQLDPAQSEVENTPSRLHSSIAWTLTLPVGLAMRRNSTLTFAIFFHFSNEHLPSKSIAPSDLFNLQFSK